LNILRENILEKFKILKSTSLCPNNMMIGPPKNACCIIPAAQEVEIRGSEFEASPEKQS
jgi:hypothetical protein